MRKILLIHGVNLNRLGKRDQNHYGSLTLHEIEKITAQEAKKRGFKLSTYQSNHEGKLVDKLQKESAYCVGIIINPGAFAHYSYALHDALLDTQLPVIEVHLSNLNQREKWRTQQVTALACIKVIEGKKEQGYREAINTLAEHLNK